MIVDGRLKTVSKDFTLSWALSYIVSPFDLIASVHWALSFGMPRSATSKTVAFLEGGIDVLNENANVVDDPVLSPIIKTISPLISAFVERAKAFARWEDQKVSSAVRERHERKTKRSGPKVPPWLATDEGKEYIESLNSSYGNIIEALNGSFEGLFKMAEELGSDESIDYLRGTRSKIPYARNVVRLGYIEAMRRAVGLKGEQRSG